MVVVIKKETKCSLLCKSSKKTHLMVYRIFISLPLGGCFVVLFPFDDPFITILIRIFLKF